MHCFFYVLNKTTNWQEETNYNVIKIYLSPVTQLRLSTAKNLLLWKTKAFQSPRSCLPLAIEYITESTDVVWEQKN